MNLAWLILNVYNRWSSDFTTCKSYCTLTKHQQKEWHHLRSPTEQSYKPTKFWEERLWLQDRKGVLFIIFMSRGKTINVAANCQMLHRLYCSIINDTYRSLYNADQQHHSPTLLSRLHSSEFKITNLKGKL